MSFTDLTKAFDTVSWKGLWKIIAKFSCLEKLIAMVRQFHDGMLAHVVDDVESSDPFPVTNKVKHGCLLAPTLFSMIFSARLMASFPDCNTWIIISYWTDGKFFNLRRLQSKTKLQVMNVCDLLFADDCSLNGKSESDMQLSMDHFSSAYDNFGFTINTKKTELMHHPSSEKPYVVNGHTLQAMEKFTYLDSTLSYAVHVNDENNARIAEAGVAFGRLRANVWERRGMNQQTKLKVYKAIVLPNLMYACETWTVYRCHATKLNHFHMGCLRNLMRVRWQDKVPDTEVPTLKN
ncbi:hypothetical protein Y1Q_0002715 [Alligator mississippiensis]|uniref:Reverse transcriptase domain-containing protein n=1 Tax=Alligator mississippiensis TaxID=8496 RepID=A0A151NZK6_ALLMI|nr:hypothetical protein Y1Q_0002715 [Alligator mississippiensis]